MARKQTEVILNDSEPYEAGVLPPDPTPESGSPVKVLPRPAGMIQTVTGREVQAVSPAEFMAVKMVRKWIEFRGDATVTAQTVNLRNFPAKKVIVKETGGNNIYFSFDDEQAAAGANSQALHCGPNEERGPFDVGGVEKVFLSGSTYRVTVGI